MATGSNVEEYKIFMSKSSRKNFQVMKFHHSTNVDFMKWRTAKLQRENNSKLYEAENEELPESGQGSEFGRKEREAVKRKRFQKNEETYNPNEQPWILKTFEEEYREYQSQIEGGFSDNAAYYVLTQSEGGLEAHPIKEWHTFQRKKQLQNFTAEEVEEQFNKSNSYTSYFSLVKRTRLNRIAEEEEEEVCKKKKPKKSKHSDSDLDESSDEECERIMNKNINKFKKNEKLESDDEAVEESDDGDGEGKEFDYISSSESDNEKEEPTILGVAEEKAIRQALDSDEDDSEEENFENTIRDQDETQEPSYSSFKSLGPNQSNKIKFGRETLRKEDKTKKSESNFDKFKKPVFVVKQRKN